MSCKGCGRYTRELCSCCRRTSVVKEELEKFKAKLQRKRNEIDRECFYHFYALHIEELLKKLSVLNSAIYEVDTCIKVIEKFEGKV